LQSAVNSDLFITARHIPGASRLKEMAKLIDAQIKT